MLTNKKKKKENKTKSEDGEAPGSKINNRKMESKNVEAAM